MNEQLDAIKAQAEGGHLDVMVIAKADVLAMLAEVERLTGEVAEYKAGREDLIQTGLSLVADRSRFRSAILSLTPGGSEFHDSPERCAEWARERMASAAKLAKERNELRAEVERLTGENANAKAALVAAAALLHQSNAEVERLTGELAAAQQEAAQVRRAGATKLMQADAEIDALRAELAAERSIMNMVPEYIQYLSKWRAGDGTFLLFNEWVAQRIAQPSRAHP